jgi:hypothetical protein
MSNAAIDTQIDQKQSLDHMADVTDRTFASSNNGNDIMPLFLDRMISCEENLKASIASLSLDDAVLNSFFEEARKDEFLNPLKNIDTLFLATPSTRSEKDTECTPEEVNSFQSRRDVYQKILNPFSDGISIPESTTSSDDPTKVSLDIAAQENTTEEQGLNNQLKIETLLDHDEIPFDEIDLIVHQ